MPYLLAPLLLPGQFIPHGHCYLWNPPLVWLHVLSDSLIALAYYSIPVTLLYFVRKRPDLPFHWIFLLFGAFIVACGTTHILEIWTLWHPHYWVSGTIKAVTAAISVYTASQLIPLVPQALALPSPAELAAANQALALEIAARQQAEAEVRILNKGLEQRIAERTQELELANQVKAELLVREQTAREQAEASSRLKDEFLATLSHELRTPLNAVLGWAQLLQSRTFPPETTTKALETIERNARLLFTLIEDLLDVSRIIQGKLRLSISPVDIAAIAMDVVETSRPAAEAKQIQIQVRIDPSVGMVLGDSNRLQQVIWNLLSNAVKFTPSAGLIKLDVSTVNQQIQICVTDTGQGITPDFLPHVFERFRQADSTLTRSQGGLGLGLAIVRHLVELHGGTVSVTSSGLNQGATFVVMLPSLQAGSRLGEGAISPTPAGILHSSACAYATDMLQGLNILVVEDDSETREFLTAVLQEYGAQVFAVASGSEALSRLNKVPYQVLVSDLGLPEQDGFMLIRQIRQLSPIAGGAIPAIAVTAYARAEDRSHALAAGFHSYLSKPVNPIELVTAIVALVQEQSSTSPAS